MKRLLLGVLISFGVFGLLLLLVPRPHLKEGLSLSRAVYDRDGRLLRLTLSSDDKYRLWLPLSEMSPLLVEATVLQEDKYFRVHPGVNPFSLVRAAWTTYVKEDRRIGGSTITMQLARIRYGLNTKTLSGKLVQIIRAAQIELHYSKKEIIEAYLNLAPYGLNIEGAGAASFVYFGKRVKNLSLEEALTLCVIPQNPVRRVLAARETNRELMEARMRLFDMWTQKHAVRQLQRRLISSPTPMRLPSDMPFLAPHFVNSVLQGSTETEIETTLDPVLQSILERVVRIYIEQKRDIGISNAAAMLLDYRTMEVKALLGSADFFNDEIQGQVDGTSAKRSPGSTVKPFVYALAMDEGLIHPMSMLKDAPTSYGMYSPENFDHEFVGPIKVKDALVRSRNLPALQVAASLAEPGFYGFLKDAGVAGLHDEEYYGLGVALGGTEMTMGELVRLYAMLANGGVIRPLRTKLTDPVVDGKRMLSREASFLTVEMLKDNPRPEQGFRADWTADSLKVAWKTGTSFAFRDAWSIGIFGPYVLAVWIGNFDGEGNPAFVGRETAGPLLFQLIDAIHAHQPDLRMLNERADYTVEEVEVCSVSGQLPGRYCKTRETAWFIPGKSPIKVCDIHREVTIDTGTGLRTADTDTDHTRKEVYEFWPSDMLKIFKQAGIPRRVPPPMAPGVSLDSGAVRGNPPQITSPQENVVYTVRIAPRDESKIPFKAVSDADSREVFWFIDEKFVGKSDSGKPFFWKPKLGSYVVRAVDDQGRSDAREFSVAAVN